MIELFKWYYLIGVAFFAVFFFSSDFTNGLMSGVPAETPRWHVIVCSIFVIAVGAWFWPLVFIFLFLRRRK